MRTKEEIYKQLKTYEANLDRVKDFQRKQVIKQAIIELSWVLGEEYNYKFDSKHQ